MSQWLRDALLELLFWRMAAHIDNGADYDEALRLGVEEIRQQIRESRRDLADMLLDRAVTDMRYVREYGTQLLH